MGFTHKQLAEYPIVGRINKGKLIISKNISFHKMKILLEFNIKYLKITYIIRQGEIENGITANI